MCVANITHHEKVIDDVVNEADRVTYPLFCKTNPWFCKRTPVECSFPIIYIQVQQQHFWG